MAQPIRARVLATLEASLRAIEEDDRRRIAAGILPRYADASAFGTDANGDFTCHVPRGGYWNDSPMTLEQRWRSSCAARKRLGKPALSFKEFADEHRDDKQRTGRAQHGITLEDVHDAKRRLKAIGFEATFDRVDEMLLRVMYGEDPFDEEVVQFTPNRRPLTGAERKARFRSRMRDLGRCSTCLRRRARIGKATCATCNTAAKERVRLWRSSRIPA